MATPTGHAAGAVSPSPSRASATRPARSSGWCRGTRPADVSLFFGLGLGADLDEFDPRRAAAWALARQHRVDDLEMARQAAPGGGALNFTGAQRACLVCHPLPRTVYRLTSL